MLAHHAYTHTYMNASIRMLAHTQAHARTHYVSSETSQTSFTNAHTQAKVIFSIPPPRTSSSLKHKRILCKPHTLHTQAHMHTLAHTYICISSEGHAFHETHSDAQGPQSKRRQVPPPRALSNTMRMYTLFHTHAQNQAKVIFTMRHI